MKAIALYKNGKKLKLPYQTKSLQETSRDHDHSVYMVNSALPVICLDDLSRLHARRFRLGGPLSSNDAFYISKGRDYFFIEFKNGSIEDDSLHKKMKGSISICNDFGIMPASFIPENVNYILVYKKQKYEEGQEHIYEGFRARAGEYPFQKYNIGTFVGLFCKSAISYTVEQFTDMFVRPMEQAEALL